jgi:hypothetical protein
MDDTLTSPQAIEGRLSLVSSHPSAAFRADTDQAGEWYVWTRLARTSAPDGPRHSTTGWATMQRCESRDLAQRLADDLNQRALRVAV